MDRGMGGPIRNIRAIRAIRAMYAGRYTLAVTQLHIYFDCTGNLEIIFRKLQPLLLIVPKAQYSQMRGAMVEYRF